MGRVSRSASEAGLLTGGGYDRRRAAGRSADRQITFGLPARQAASPLDYDPVPEWAAHHPHLPGAML